MEFTNLLTVKNRDELRKWLADNHDKEIPALIPAGTD